MKKQLRNFAFIMAALAALWLPSDCGYAQAADPSSGTIEWNQGPSLGWNWSAVPVLGYPAGGTSGTLGLANGGASGATVTIGNPSATTAYEFDFPAAAPSAGQVWSASGTNGTAGTWVSVQPTASPTFTGTVTAPNIVVNTTADISPAFSTTAIGNPVAKTTYGSLTVAAVNAGTGTILAGVSTRKITVTNFDIVAVGSAATCTGVLLEDDNGTPVVVSTLAAATLTNLAHNVPLAATLGVGFGGGSGLTSGAGLQLKVNGSGCTTTTAFQYMVSYVLH